MDIASLAYTISSVMITVILIYDSARDFKYRTISRRSVTLVFLIVLISKIFTGIPAESTFVFILALGAFVSFAAISRGRFGMGDALLIGAISWQLGSFEELQQFIYAMGSAGVVLWFFYFLKNKEYKNIKESFRGNKITTVLIDEVKIGSVLATDNFMAGLTAFDIENLKKSGMKEIQIKPQPLPFIPCICFAYLLLLFL